MPLISFSPEGGAEMQLDHVTAEIRPRSDWEAVDLGLAMVRRDFWRCLTVWWLALAIPTLLSGWLLWDSPMLWFLLFWWMSPAGSRMVLFELSRRLFGEKPTLKSSLREIPRAWTRRFFYRFIWARFSPWLPLTLAVEDLEGLRGAAYKQRCAQITRRGEGVILWIYLVADLAACWFGIALMAMVYLFIPEGQDGAWQMAVESWDPSDPFVVPNLLLRCVVCCVMVSKSLADLFVIGAGFGIYINNRTWIEGWDVELAFKRMARRLQKVVVVIVFASIVFFPAQVRAARVEAEPARVIQEVKAQPEFKVHTVKERVPKESTTPSWLERFLRWLNFSPDSGGGFFSGVELLGRLFIICVIAGVVGLIVWLIWINRHAFLLKGSRIENTTTRSIARVVMGMDVSPETLPADVPTAAWQLWNEGKHQEALGLLYRGAISMAITSAAVEIQESDTEGDCMRRVDDAGAAAHPGYFRGITRAWLAMAYAGMRPDDHTVQALCQSWPFHERRNT
jgi:hypothetical protein